MGFSIGRNEDLRERINTTPEQEAYLAAWAGRADFQRGKVDMPYMGVAFKPRPRRLETGRSEVVPLREGQLVRSLDSVEAAVISRIPGNRWRGHRGNARWRLNLLRLRFTVADGGVEARPHGGHFDQYDLEKWPIQDHPVLDEYSWSPSQLIAAPGELAATEGGVVEYRSNDLYTDIYLACKPYARVSRENVERVAKEGDVVKEGDVIVRFSGLVKYGLYRLNRDGRPVMDRIGGDVLSATRHSHLLHAANRCMEQMQAGRPSGMPEEVMPRVMVHVSHAQFERLLHDPAWQVTPALERVILAGLAPGGDLTVAGVFRRVYHSSSELDENACYLAAKAALEKLAVDAASVGLPVSGKLIEAGYVPYSLANAGLYLDFRPCARFLDPETGTISLALPHPAWDDFVLFAGGAAYDFSPQGERLVMPQPKPGRRRRRNRHKPAVAPN